MCCVCQTIIDNSPPPAVDSRNDPNVIELMSRLYNMEQTLKEIKDKL